MFSTFILGSAIVLAGSAHAQTTHEVMTDGLAYSPNTLTDVAEGDMVRLTFSKTIPHNVQSSTFDSPCTYDSAGGLASDTYNKGEVFEWMVNSTDPAFFFCSVGSHCQSGMILAINPTDSETQEMAVTNAEGSESEGAPEGMVVGGMLATGGSSGGGSSSMMESAMSSTAMPSSSTMASDSTMPSETITSSDSTMASESAMATSSGMASSTSMGGDMSMTSTGSMPSETSAAAGSEGSAEGLRSSVAMVAAVVGAAIAFAV